jgi:pimeloyl-ACP methyl ester carboxylesterase
MNFLFLHGLAGSNDDWLHTQKLLKEHGHACLAPAVPFLDGDYDSLSDLSAKLRRLIPEHFLGSGSILVGNSLGGPMALLLGQHASSIVLVASHTSISTKRIGRGVDTLNRELDRIFHRPDQLSKEQRERYEQLWSSLTSCRENFKKLGRIKRAIGQDDMDRYYRAYQSKIHVICGEEDQLSPIENFIALKQQYPAIRMSRIPRCGHAIPIEKPTQLARILLKE